MSDQWTATLTIRNLDTGEYRAESFTSTRRGAASWMSRQCRKYGNAFAAGAAENVNATSFRPV